MSRQEFIAWAEFYKLHPFDDFHRIHKPAAMIAAAQGGASVAERLEWLAPARPQHDDGWTDADAATLRALGVLKG